MNYGLNIIIDSDSTERINRNNQKVTIVKQTNSSIQTANSVAWLTFAPYQDNEVTWEEQYGVYATKTELQNGAVIRKTSDREATDSYLYTFKNNVFDGGTSGKISTGIFGVENESGDNEVKFGLTQMANVNGTIVTSPLNIMPVMNNQTGTFEPIETVYIFLSSSENNGTVISNVFSKSCTVTLTGSKPTAKIGFNAQSNQFFVQEYKLANVLK